MLMFISNISTTAVSKGYLWLLLTLLLLCLIAIAVLAVIVIRQRKLIERKNDYIVRYVGQYLSLKYNEFPELHKRYSECELTQSELIEIMHLLKKMLCCCALLMPALPTVAQERTDTTYVFRFVPTDDMFYVPFGNNEIELQRLEECVEENFDGIMAGLLPLRVDGYCNSESSRKANLTTAKIRSNRVKSELIIRSGLAENCFITRNHATDGDYVTVRLVVPKAQVKEARPAEENRIDTPEGAECSLPIEPEKETVAETPVKPEKETITTITDSQTDNRHLAFRANLLRWATLTPDLGLEWRINRHVGILVNGSWTSWSWNDKNRRYALWEVAPEVRYYIGKEKCGYIGAMYKAGAFNYKLSATGKQGDLMGGGITGGYQLQLNKALSLDFNLGLGYIHADYEKYNVIDGVRVRNGKETKNWWGPVHAGVTLTWNIF